MEPWAAQGGSRIYDWGLDTLTCLYNPWYGMVAKRVIVCSQLLTMKLTKHAKHKINTCQTTVKIRINSAPGGFRCPKEFPNWTKLGQGAFLEATSGSISLHPSRAAFHFHSFQGSEIIFRKPSNTQGNSDRFLKRTMVEKNGESTRRTLPTAQIQRGFNIRG